MLKKYGLIGYPLTHSFSQKYFTEKFQQLGLADCVYDNHELKDVAAFLKLKDEKELRGLNVTIPYKEAIIPFLDDLSDEAKKIGAVNCIRFMDGQCHGHNTDAYGFEMSIKPFLENKYERALILGTGGGSRAVAYVLRKWNIPFHYVSRTAKGEQTIAYSDLRADTIKHFQLIINTTPLGMFPHVDESPDIPYEGLGPAHFLYDLIYNPSETQFLKGGKEQGAHIMNGLKMLEWQAERSWEIWNS
jgi:shikimate dehydrogenase